MHNTISGTKSVENVCLPGSFSPKLVENDHHLKRLEILNFEHIQGEKLEERLKKMKPDLKKLKTFKNSLKVLVGNGKSIGSIVEAVNYLFQRDFSELYQIDHDNKQVPIKTFIPEYYLTRATNYLVPENGPAVLENLSNAGKIYSGEKELFNKEHLRIDSAKKVYSGDKPEMNLYHSLKDYFSAKSDFVTIFHGHKLYNIDITIESADKKVSEKDFIIVNLSMKYLMIIESKKNLGAADSIQKACSQLLKAKEALESWFGADIDSTWQYIPVIYCEKLTAINTTSAHIIKGKTTCRRVNFNLI